VAVKIRLKRLGKIRAPYYRIVVADSRTRRDGRVIEEIGKYHPKEEPSFIEVKSERAQYWLGVGAQPTEAVEAILKVTGDWQRHKGEGGAEGTLRTKQPGRTKQEIFNEILKESGGEPPTEAVTRRGAGTAAAPAGEATDEATGATTGGTTGGAAAAATASSSGSNEVGAPRETGDAASVVES
jgi:small subunit ribosomal protein S16